MNATSDGVRWALSALKVKSAVICGAKMPVTRAVANPMPSPSFVE
ncbi:MAG: hypothetical protein A4E49_01155 [Methanosaeta sp. PtaU1.Bin112]|nr:MAG: hypothetical protein A4E49_01155 [Methanosaeta sp. PtaU1.Bin112]